MRKILYVALSLLFLNNLSFAQLNMREALQKGGWSGGLAGWVGWENFDVSANSNGMNNNSKVDGFNFIFSSRNGSIVETNGVFGFDFQWREKTRTTTPDPNLDNSSKFSKERTWFLGLWARYYIPLTGNFAIYIEGSGGYAVFNHVNELKSTEELETAESFANGFAYNGGIGFSNFVTPNVSFEITGRYEGGSLNGNTRYSSGLEDDLNVKIGSLFILFGFQIFLR